MIARIVKKSPQVYARTGGMLELIIIIAGLFAEVFVRSNLIQSGDASATADNITASQLLFRMGFAAELIMLVCDVVVALILYALLKPVDKNLALLAAFFRLVMAAVSGINALNHFAALFFLAGGGYLTVFQTDQLQALALLSLKSHAYGHNISLVFFGFHCLILGYLIFRSDYLPRFLGILLMIAFLSYFINSFTFFIAPQYAAIISPGILLPALISAVSLSLWLIFMGINTAKWEKKAAVERVSEA